MSYSLNSLMCQDPLKQRSSLDNEPYREKAKKYIDVLRFVLAFASGP